MSNDPMPTFTILGKDALAVDAVDAYVALCRARGLDGQAVEVWAAREEIRAWQARNEGAVKLPDHKHVPVDGHVDGETLVRRPDGSTEMADDEDGSVGRVGFGAGA